ncbi:hypothetical protein [Micromonospora sp. NPDC048169]|uniref:hypothetical protein n=1 Tax=Micromonospora sp. NPDC048169 TaxID=3154711 RepID=UPI0033FF92BA
MSDQTPREQLATALRLRRGIDTAKVIDAVITAGWRPPARVITDPTELDALGGGSIVVAGTKRDRNGRAWQCNSGRRWFRTGDPAGHSSTELLTTYGSVTVLHTPENGETP